MQRRREGLIQVGQHFRELQNFGVGLEGVILVGVAVLELIR